MARVDSTIVFRPGGPRASGKKYPWDNWLDGSTWVLTKGEDFDVPVDDFKSYIYRVAAIRNRQRGGNVNINVLNEHELAVRYLGDR